MEKEQQKDIQASFLKWIDTMNSKYTFTKDEIEQLSKITIELFGKTLFF